MNKIAVIGSGYVGLVCGACLSDFGMNVTCVDNNEEKISNLKKGISPIYEAGLEDLIVRNSYNKRLFFTSDIKEAVEKNEVIFIAVGTPPMNDGSADLSYVTQVAKEIAKYMNGYKVIVDKSTVPVGTAKLVRQVIEEVLRERDITYEFDVVSNPEFLREGAAIRDFTHPDRVIIGSESEKATNIMKEVYRVLYLNETPFLITNLQTAELTKYAANAFLATKITFINELTELCEKVNANINQVSKGIGMDNRIGSKFLHAGPGYGGSCFPKDTKALTKIASENGCTLSIVEATISANERQKLRLARKVSEVMGDLNGKTISVLGLAFKPETDDMRDSPAIKIIFELEKLGAKFKVFDPQAHKEAKWRFETIDDKIQYCEDEYDAVTEADSVIILTEWNQFRNLNLAKIKENMHGNYFFDYRNIYNGNNLRELEFKYYSIGRD